METKHRRLDLGWVGLSGEGGGWGGGGMAEASAVSMGPWVNSILADRSKICLGNLPGHHTRFSLGFGAR